MNSSLYVDTDSVKVERQFQELLKPYYQWAVKNELNSIYGFMVENELSYIKNDSLNLEENYKEIKNMNKNYIVVHDKMNGLGIVFKDKIGGVFKDEDGTAKLLIVDGYMLLTNDKYEDIVKQII